MRDIGNILKNMETHYKTFYKKMLGMLNQTIINTSKTPYDGMIENCNQINDSITEFRNDLQTDYMNQLFDRILRRLGELDKKFNKFDVMLDELEKDIAKIN
ncbi:hypothetical protein [Desulfosporosinus sp. FKA]|uniref:hypothetical protein n=1 Tax=Desulfosporosinus sp. FKA TaxID=1969834 RepID=UPI000B4A235B|nr:hypothetical protein [Desulfosporosinus sp. FKA]